MRPDPEAVEAVLTWKAPKTDTQLMSFLGFANYYREFIMKKIWCVKLMDDAHAPEIMSGQMNVVKTYLKARYRLSDLLRAQRNDRMTSSLKRWIENGAPDKGDLEEDSYKILKQFYLKRNDLLYLNKDGIVACKRKEEDKVL